MRDLSVDLVLDVGANIGQYASDIRSHGYGGRLLSFEPLSSAFAELSKTAAVDPNWTVRRVALGASASRMSINVAGNSTSSSFLPMLQSHQSAAPESRYFAKEEIDVIPLDSLVGRDVGPHEKVWLKMDVQGFEMEVLKGAGKLLPQVVGMECEMSLVPLYEGEPLIEEVLKEIANRGFRLAIVTEAFFAPDSGRSLQLNGVFLRSGLHPTGAQQ
jgi:FkbM family methyltransferase